MKGAPPGASSVVPPTATSLALCLLTVTAQWSTGLRRMTDRGRQTVVGGERTRLTVSPSRLQFQFVAKKPSGEGRSGWTSKTGLCQRRHASNCSNTGTG
jgi:hypothetical protein